MDDDKPSLSGNISCLRQGRNLEVVCHTDSEDLERLTCLIGRRLRSQTPRRCAGLVVHRVASLLPGVKVPTEQVSITLSFAEAGADHP